MTDRDDAISQDYRLEDHRVAPAFTDEALVWAVRRFRSPVTLEIDFWLQRRQYVCRMAAGS